MNTVRNVSYNCSFIFICCLLLFTSCKKSPYKGSLFPIQKDGNWGYIDSTGQIIIEPQFINAFEFNEGLAKVLSESEIKYIDKGGNILFSSEIIDGGKYINYINDSPDPNEGFIPLKTNKGLFLYDTDGNSHEFNFTVDKIYKYSNGLMRFNIGENFGFIQPGLSAFKINPIFTNALDFSEGLAAVYKRSKGWGYINKEGDFVINPQFRSGQNFSEGLALVEDEKATSFIDKSGKQKIKANKGFEFRSGFQNNYALISFTKEFNCREKTILDMEALREYGYKPVTHRVCDYETRFGLIDKSGKTVIPVIHPALKPLSENLAAFKSGGKWGYINIKNEVVIPAQFDRAFDFKNGLARVELKDSYNGFKVGYINSSGQYIWQPTN